MAFDTIDINNLNIGSPIFGDSLLFPNALREPGILSAHKGHFGQGATVIPFTAALVAGPSLSTPLPKKLTVLDQRWPNNEAMPKDSTSSAQIP